VFLFFLAHVYVAEISSCHSRGFFCSFLSLSLAFGITFVTVVGSLVNDWKLITVLCIIPVVIGKKKIVDDCNDDS
jgi:cadmium resistance protein CadD (predicted permease)